MAYSENKKAASLSTCGFLVGAAGFEPTTSCSQSRRDTGLRYAPKVFFEVLSHFFAILNHDHLGLAETRYRAKPVLSLTKGYAPKKIFCGERGIRTPGTVSRTAV